MQKHNKYAVYALWFFGKSTVRHTYLLLQVPVGGKRNPFVQAKPARH